MEASPPPFLTYGVSVTVTPCVTCLLHAKQCSMCWLLGYTSPRQGGGSLLGDEHHLRGDTDILSASRNILRGRRF